MNLLELNILALGLSMDAFAVAITIGLTLKAAAIKKALIVGIYFGAFQAGMPLIGYFTAMQFADYITRIDHWIVFALLTFLGSKMILGSFKKDDSANAEEASLGFAKMLPLALATSVDAMAVGVSFAFMYVNVFAAVITIGLITFAMSMAGVKIGNAFGVKFKSRAELAGGGILVIMGVWTLVEHFI